MPKNVTPHTGPLLSPKLEKKIRNQVNFGRNRAYAFRADATLTIDEWRSIFIASEGKCHYCSKYIGYEKLVLEHVVSLGWGGHHTPDNVVPACQSCNVRKGVNKDTQPPLFAVPIPATGWEWIEEAQHWRLHFTYMIEEGYKLSGHCEASADRQQRRFLIGWTHVYRPGSKRWIIGRMVGAPNVTAIWPDTIGP